MKVQFDLFIENQYRNCSGDPALDKEEDYRREFTTEWGNQPLPSPGDTISFDHFIKKVDPRLTSKTNQVFFGRGWTVDYTDWEWDPEQKAFAPMVFLKDGRK